MNEDAEYGGLWCGWRDTYHARKVYFGEPLDGSEFKDCRAATIWGAEDGHMTGAVIRFAEASSTDSFGYYVHIGAEITLDSDGHVTDADYYRGYVGAGAGIWMCVMRFAAEDVISRAERAIADAEAEGRTKELYNARRLLQDAIGENKPPWVAHTLQIATEATDSANSATQPSIVEILALPLVALGIVGIITGTGLATKRKNNSKKAIISTK